MSQINELIAKLCPNGVEWKKLGDVCEYSKKRIVAAELNSENYVSVENLLQNKMGKTQSECCPIAGSWTKFEAGDVLVGNIRPYLRKIWLADINGGTNGDVLAIHIKDRAVLIPSYLHFILSSEDFFTYDTNHSKGAKMPRGDKKAILAYTIPLPPLEIQNRIVEILDHFTNLTANLTAELNLRRKQFEHYREKLLSLDGVEGVEWKKLFDVAKNSTGLTYKPSNVSDSGTLVLRSSNIQNSSLCFDDNVFVQMDSIPERALVKENDILVCVRNGSSALIGKAAIIDKRCEGMAFGAFMTILRAFKINYKYLFYVWLSDGNQKMVHGDSGAPINQITNAVLDKIVIPVPPLAVQQSIVEKLDKFTALIENIEKELDLRQKQYEYYREKLLSFK